MNQWTSQNIGAYCCEIKYKNITPIKDEQYGLFYNWFAATDNRGICPKGWHVPSYSELSELINYLGGERTACSQLANLVTVGNNAELCGNGMPSNKSHWWSCSKSSSGASCLRFIYDANCSATLVSDQTFESEVTSGYYIKCVKDK